MNLENFSDIILKGFLGIFIKSRGGEMSKRADDNYISLEEAANYLDIKPVTLRKWIKSKADLPAHQIGRLWKFKRAELDEWVNSGKSAIE